MKKYFLTFGLSLFLGLFITSGIFAQDGPTWVWDSPWWNLEDQRISTNTMIRAQDRVVAETVRPFMQSPLNRFDLGYAANVGAGLEMYRNNHDTRAGEFRFVYGVGDFGDVRFIHADGLGGFHLKMLLNKEGDLFVDGKITATELEVKLDVWPDFVFADDYELMSLYEVENYIQQNRHLPNVPSEAEVLQNGVNVGEMTSILLQKVEELTLHIIELNKRIEELEK